MWLFKNPVFRLFVTLVSLLLVYNLSRSISDLWARRGIILERKSVLNSLELRNAKLSEQLTTATSSAYLERQARDKLGMVRPGETLVLLNQPEIINPQLPEAKLTNWQKWLKLFIE